MNEDEQRITAAGGLCAPFQVDYAEGIPGGTSPRLRDFIRPERIERRPGDYNPYDSTHPINVAARERREADLARAKARWSPPYEALLAATEGVVRSIVELHSPRIESYNADETSPPECQGCDAGRFAESEPEWPCSTARAIASSVGVEMPRHWLYDDED